MKRLLFVALAMAVSAGCKKMMDSPDNSKSGGGGGVVAGGGGGAVMAVRNRITREEARIALEQIRLFIDAASIDGTMPTPETTFAALQREAPKYAKMVTDGHLVLNKAQSREDIWAYTETLTSNIVIAVTASGIEELNPESLRQRLGR